ncbi:UNVERIFIED_CONTAM: Phenylalanine N-monooxygenase CYP79D16 [Sesamum angustifolium]|uniref:Phenylalanine N-monooxygenase CYP79D16 n=1 Tax=Sesamum angustifolium TaxID=2727405 RepID=A0AAW2KLY9_9LAMI
MHCPQTSQPFFPANIKLKAMEINIAILYINFLALLALSFATMILNKRLRLTKRTVPSLPPGPMGYPIIGCFPKMMKNKPAFRWIHRLMQEINTEIACIRLGNAYVIPVTSPKLAREFLKKHDVIFASRPDALSAKLTSNGYLTTVFSSYGDQWKKMTRVIASEVLSPAMHRWLYGKRCEEVDHMMRYVYNQCQSPITEGLVNVRVVAQHYCGNLTRKLIFSKRFFGTGMEDGGPGMEEKEHLHGIFTILKYVYGLGIADYLPWLEVFDLDGHKTILKDAIRSVRKYQDPEINKREIMLAAVDNPSNAVDWALAEMINQPDILHRACQELDEVVGRDRLVDESDLSKLNYVKACIKEAFRLHPMVPFNVPHVSSKDTIVGGYFIPKGSQVLLSRLGLGRNPRIWEDPLVYKPERHIGNKDLEVMLVDHELRMLSFSTGRRGCPGIVLGSTMTTILLARLIQGFNWTAPPNGPSNVDLTESEGEMVKATPLIAHVVPRLEPHVYLKLMS